MAKRIFEATGYTATATSDSTTLLANSTFQAIRGGTGTQRIDILEVLISGLSGATTASLMQLARVGLMETTSSALLAPNSDGPEDPATAALAAPATTFVNATANPARSSAVTDARLNLALNTFGGIIRWNAAPTQQWVILGSVTPFGESVLSAHNAGSGASGVVSSHIIYEPY